MINMLANCVGLVAAVEKLVVEKPANQIPFGWLVS